MTKIPSVAYDRVVRALQRDGWVVVRQKGNHIRLQVLSTFLCKFLIGQFFEEWQVVTHFPYRV